ncbi:MAG: MFS transporter, partial [Trueperaceae bacterium]|nr:MFS transporter [Trueperaceae bacterium]
AGQLSLGTGAFMGAGAYTCYKLTTIFPQVDIVLVILASGLVPALIGVAFGLPSLRIKGFYLAVATLAAQSLVADVRNGRSTAQNFGWFTTTLSGGRLVGPLLAGVVVDLAGFRAAFAVVVLATAVPVAIAAWLRRAFRRADVGDGAASGAAADAAGVEVDLGDAERVRRQAAGPTLANVGVQLAVLASAGVFVAVSVRQAFLPVLLTDLGYSATAIGALVSVGSLAAVLVRPAMPWFARALGGPARALVVAMAAVAVGIGALGLVGSWGTFTALAVVAGFGTGVGLPLSIVTVASHVDPRRRGAALGLRLSLNRAAQLIMPVAMGALLATSGFAVAFGLTGAALAALAVLAALRVPTFERTPPVA